ncbi:hypothetical protein [Acinetobacter bouvetii]|nr:hypothetical protein [Acinetobacter bouvetii]
MIDKQNMVSKRAVAFNTSRQQREFSHVIATQWASRMGATTLRYGE